MNRTGSAYLVVGLGNPGSAYADTRHNVGFRVADELAHRRRARWEPTPWAEIARVSALLLLTKPQLYMNRSGFAVENLLAYLGPEVGELVVIVDDVDLPLGRLRLKRRGGPGTHNGMRDLCARVGSDFGRLRVGVGHGDCSADLADYVLSPFTEAELRLAEETIIRAADAIEMLLALGWNETMAVVNRRELANDGP